LTKEITTALQTLIAASDVDQRCVAFAQAIVAITKRLAGQGDRTKRAATTKDKLTSKEAAEAIGVCRSSLSMLANDGNVTPSNSDAHNGAGHRYDTAHIRNFCDLHSSGEISCMIADFATRREIHCGPASELANKSTEN